MKLYVAKIAPNPLRVEYFLKEKGIYQDFEIIDVELANETKGDEHLKRNRLGQVPVLELNDGRFLSESRAICTFIEGIAPDHNLMGVDFEERAFIEMHDRQIEHGVLYPIFHWIRHIHPGLANLEKPQIEEWGRVNESRTKKALGMVDVLLAKQEYVAGDRFTIADITLFCGINFLRVVKYKAWEEFENINIWRNKILTRPAFS